MTHSRSWDMEIMTTLGWKCHTRAAPSCDIFNPRAVIFPCPTHYLALSVKCMCRVQVWRPSLRCCNVVWSTCHLPVRGRTHQVWHWSRIYSALYKYNCCPMLAAAVSSVCLRVQIGIKRNIVSSVNCLAVDQEVMRPVSLFRWLRKQRSKR